MKTWDDNDPQTTPPEPPAISNMMDKVTIDPRWLLLILQWFKALLSTTQHHSLQIPLTLPCGAHSGGDTSYVPQLFFMRRKLSGPKAKRTQLWKDKRAPRSMAMCLGRGGKCCHFSVHRQRSLFCLPTKNPTFSITLKCKLCLNSVSKKKKINVRSGHLRSKCG